MTTYSMMTPEEREEWADDHGYVRYRCPHGHGSFWSDSGPEGNCPSCGPDPDGLRERCENCNTVLSGMNSDDEPLCPTCKAQQQEEQEAEND
jgi:rubrerythrin